MRYLRRGDIYGANAACGNLDPESVGPLPDDPLVAITQGYLALRQGQITHMQDWLISAPEAWPWLPDTYVIAAECFARAGCHLTALSNLRQLQSVGLPLFTEGYTIVVNRLSSYTTRLPKKDADTLSKESGDVPAKESTAESVESVVFEMAQKLASWDVAEAASMHRELAPWARYIDLQRITLTLVGADLNLRIDAPVQRQLPQWLTAPAVKAVQLANQVGMLIGRGLAWIAGLNDRPIHETAYGGTRDSRASD